METLRLFVPLARELGVSSVESELRRLSSTHMQRPAAIGSSHWGSLIDLLPGSGAALDQLARLSCPEDALDELLSSDEDMRSVDELLPKLRERWAEHCVQVGEQLPVSDEGGETGFFGVGDAMGGGGGGVDGSLRGGEGSNDLLSHAAAVAFGAPIIVAAPAVTNAAEHMVHGLGLF